MPFKLELWEKAFLEAAYGFKYKESGLRRFNEALLLIARKNGKTTFIAGIDIERFLNGKMEDRYPIHLLCLNYANV